MEKVKCPVCKRTLMFVEHINAEVKCNGCKQIIKITKKTSDEHTETIQK